MLTQHFYMGDHGFYRMDDLHVLRHRECLQCQGRIVPGRLRMSRRHRPSVAKLPYGIHHLLFRIRAQLIHQLPRLDSQPGTRQQGFGYILLVFRQERDQVFWFGLKERF